MITTEEAVFIAKKCYRCITASAYKCGLIGCENCENEYDAKEYCSLLNWVIAQGEDNDD